MFCHEALAEVSAKMKSITGAGARVVFVHMISEAEVAPMMEGHGLGETSRISDPDRKLYAAFGLAEGGLGAMLSPKVWACGIKATLAGHLPRRPNGNVWQMPGVFLIYREKVLARFVAKTISDKPDFESFVRTGLESVRNDLG
ncbi:MAG: hypothetical protein KDA54_10830 [Phycisphaerales bacterium]|nr:hypothetical protein [Phycisphaerales bacterium]